MIFCKAGLKQCVLWSAIQIHLICLDFTIVSKTKILKYIFDHLGSIWPFNTNGGPILLAAGLKVKWFIFLSLKAQKIIKKKDSHLHYSWNHSSNGFVT